MTVLINTRVPFFLWKMTEKEAEIQNNVIRTSKTFTDDDGKEKIEHYENKLEKAPLWLIFMVKYLPILLIFLTADWGVRLWNGIGFFFAAAYMLWFVWMVEQKPKQFYPVTIASVIVVVSIGFASGTLLYANHIVSDVVYLFLLKLIYDDYTFLNNNRYFTVVGKIGMFVYIPIENRYTEKDKNIINMSLIGLMGLSLIVIVVNSVIIYKEYRQNEITKKRMLNIIEHPKKSHTEFIAQKPQDENLTKDQIQLRKQLGIGEEQ